MTTIFGIKLDNRVQTAIDFQKVLTHYGCSIKTRLGLHDVSDNVCAPNGLILLEVINDEEAAKMKEELLEIPNLELQSMKF
jgi:hypothetical protein